MKVSVITPSYNQGQFIERTINSVAIQRENLAGNIQLEHIIFDACSTDKTIDILKKSAHPITWFSEKDNGQAHAVNKGIMHSDGEIIGWLNSDDIYFPDAINKVVNYFKLNPDVDVVYGMAYHIDINDNSFELYPTKPWDFKNLQTDCFICQPAVFFKRSILSKAGLLDESLDYCMDYEFWIRLSIFGAKFGYMQEVLAGSRMYSDNKTLRAKVAVHKEINDMLKKHLSYVPMKAIINYAYVVVGESIDKSKEPYRFAFKLLTTSFASASLWNKNIFKFTIQALFHWTKSLFLGRFCLWRKSL
jgi:glycosyltransferase involved in cell wall biosynthesis